jgi:glycosyltransferase involved in cell wall biosynthesis
MAEANACGTPVITCPAGAAPEVVAHGSTGVIATDDDALIAGLHRAWGGAFRADVCRQHVEQRFSAETMAAGYEELFTRVCAGEIPKAPAGSGALPS